MGVLKRIRGALEASALKGDTSAEELLEHLQTMGIEAELADSDQTHWEEQLSSEPVEARQRIKLTGQGFDEMRVFFGGYPYQRTYHIRYVVRWSARGLERSVKAKTKKVKEHKFWGKVINIKWSGRGLAQSLNCDTDLTWRLVEEGQTSIKIKPNWRRQSVEIISPSVTVLYQALPSNAAFEAYNRIAKHIRSYSESQTTT